MSVVPVSTEESILKTIRHLIVGSDEEYSFDIDLKIHINSVFSRLYTLGVGPINGFQITDENDTWNSYLASEDNLEILKTYIYIKVRLLFDPPANATVINAMTEQAKEYEWVLQNCSSDRNNEVTKILEGDQNEYGNESC